MILVLKTILSGKRIGMAAAMLAVCMCLSLIDGAFADPTPTPTPTLSVLVIEATPTPTPGGDSGIVDPGNNGNFPGGSDWQGPGQGDPNDPNNPPQPPVPPKQDNRPTDEPNIPVEIDPDDVSQKPFRPKKAKIKKMVGTYTIIANGTQSYVGDQWCKWNYTLNFQATKVSGPYIDGNYSGKGTLVIVLDNDHYTASDDYFVHGELEHTGPLDIKFTLVDPDEGKLAPLVPEEDKLAPLVPPTMAEGTGTMFWNPTKVKDYFVFSDGQIQTNSSPAVEAESLICEVIVYKGGSATVRMWYSDVQLSYKGRLVKSVTLVDAN